MASWFRFGVTLGALMLGSIASSSDLARHGSNRLPEGMTWHEGWISLRSGQPADNLMTAVIYNPGKDSILVSMADNQAEATLLCRTPDGWTGAGPFYWCGNGKWQRPLAPGDSLKFTFSPSQMSSKPDSVVREYRVILPVQHGKYGMWATAVSLQSFRFP